MTLLIVLWTRVQGRSPWIAVEGRDGLAGIRDLGVVVVVVVVVVGVVVVVVVVVVEVLRNVLG